MVNSNLVFKKIMSRNTAETNSGASLRNLDNHTNARRCNERGNLERSCTFNGLLVPSILKIDSLSR